MTTDATPTPEHGQSPDAQMPSAGPYGPVYHPGPWVPTAAPIQPTRGPGWAAQTVAGVATAIVVAALGFPLGWLWSSLAPWLPVTASDGSLFYADPEGSQSAGQEGWYVLISIGAGVILAILAWVLLRRLRGPITMIGLALGGLLSGWIMWRFGRSIGRAAAKETARSAADGTNFKIPVDIRIERNGLWHGFVPYVAGDLVYLAISAVAVYAIIAGFAAYPDLIARRRIDKATATTAGGPVGQWPGVTPGETTGLVWPGAQTGVNDSKAGTESGFPDPAAGSPGPQAAPRGPQAAPPGPQGAPQGEHEPPGEPGDRRDPS